jgi:hypothetical protein
MPESDEKPPILDCGKPAAKSDRPFYNDLWIVAALWAAMFVAAILLINRLW